MAPSLLASLMGRDTKSKRTLARLEEPVSMSFANETPLEDVLKYIKAATAGAQRYTVSRSTSIRPACTRRRKQ